MQEQKFDHGILILRDPAPVFNYVTNPNKWYEWYPSSRPTGKTFLANEAGHEFQVVTIQQPIRFVPYTLTRVLTYRVCDIEKDRLWKIQSFSDLVDTTTTYTLEKKANGTYFHREFCYKTKRWLKYVEPLLLRRKLKKTAEQGLNNVKERLESIGA